MDMVLDSTRMNDVSTHPLVSWRSMIAGLLVALFSYMILLALGVAAGAVNLIDGTEVSARNIGLMTGAWVLSSAALSLMLGSYFAARISKWAAPMVGSAQSVVIAALFFGIMAFQMMTTLGFVGQAVGLAGKGLGNVAQSPVVADAVETSLQGLNLRQDPGLVAESVTIRLLQGNPAAARDYLARQSGVTPAELQTRIDALQAQLQQALADAASATARAVATAAWSFFAMMIIGLLFAVLGGFLGSRTNVRKPLSRTEFRSTMRPATI